MSLSLLVNRLIKSTKLHAPEIFTATAIVGVFTTSYLTGKASIEAHKLLDQEGTLPVDRKERYKEVAHHTWRLYIPPVASGVITVGCIVGASRTSSRRTAAAVAAYSLTERAFSEYREKVVEQIGKNKEQKIRDEIAQDQVKRYPTTSREVIVVGGGHVLCCELYTNRYFRSDMEAIRKSVNDINAKIISSPYVNLDEFYELVGLPRTSNSGNMGWDSDKLLELSFSAVFAEGDEPCLAFDYNYLKPI